MDNAWLRERPILARLPETRYQRDEGFGSKSYTGSNPEGTIADWLTVYQDEELLAYYEILDNLYDLLLNPDSCREEYLDWLAAINGFDGTRLDSDTSVGGKSDSNTYTTHNLDTMVGSVDLYKNGKYVFANKRFVQSQAGGDSTVELVSGYCNLYHDKDGTITHTESDRDFTFKLNTELWRNWYPTRLKRWLIKNAWQGFWSNLGTKYVLQSVFRESGLIAEVRDMLADRYAGEMETNVHLLVQFIPFTYYVLLPREYERDGIAWRMAKHFNEAYGSVGCDSRICYNAWYPDISVPGDIPGQ